MLRLGLALFVVLLLAPSAWALDLGKGTFSWTAPIVDSTHGAPTSYTLKCGGAAGGPYALTRAVTGTPLPTSLAVNQVVTTVGTYFCVVTASNVGGEGPPSNEVSFQGDWSPSSPANLQVQ